LRRGRRTAARNEGSRKQEHGEPSHAFSIRSSPSSTETASVSEASRSE
jgi:hypothetical protein